MTFDDKASVPAVSPDAAGARVAPACVGAFALVAAVWFVLDRASKAFFDQFTAGQLIAGPYFGLVQFRLVHNTGAAWGMFDDSTFLLGITSLVVCAAIVALFALFPRIAGHAPTMLETCALALVFSGGVGNAVDRFAQGYVVDFIETAFMDFPVFNVADIGVTCGFALLVIGYLLATRADAGDAGEGERNASGRGDAGEGGGHE